MESDIAQQAKVSAEKARMSLVRLVVVLCFSFFFIAPFMTLAGGDNATIQQIAIAVIGGLSVVLGWAFGSSFGSAQKQESVDKMLDKVGQKTTSIQQD